MGRKITNPVKAIRARCIDCCGGSYKEVELCAASDCPLFPFRNGKNPYRATRQLSDEEKEKCKARLAGARKSKK